MRSFLSHAARRAALALGISSLAIGTARAQATGGVKRAGAEASAATSSAPFQVGKWYVGPRFWGASGWGGTGFGAQVERGWRSVGDGENTLGIGGSIDRFAPAFGIAGANYSIITTSAFVNLHFGVGEASKLDPFVGLGLGYTRVSFPDEVFGVGATYNSGLLFNPRAGVRYFVTPRFAVQADVGYGIGYLGAGGAVRF